MGTPRIQRKILGEEAGEMRRKRPARPRVKHNRDAVWELLDRLGMSWNEPALRSYGNAADLHYPRPGDGQLRDSTLP